MLLLITLSLKNLFLFCEYYRLKLVGKFLQYYLLFLIAPLHSLLYVVQRYLQNLNLQIQHYLIL